MFPLFTELGQDGAEDDCSTMDNRELVVASRYFLPLLPTSERPFEDVPVLVPVGVERRWTPTTLPRYLRAMTWAFFFG